MNRLNNIRKALFTWPYFLIFIFVFFLFGIFNIYINDSFLIFIHLGTLRLWFAIFFVFFYILVAFLVSLTFNLGIIRFSKLGSFNSKEGGFAVLGGFAGVLGGSCPACLAGFFPAFMGFLGISFGLIDLPLQGLEIQMISSVLLGISIFMLSSEPVCKIRFDKE